MTAVEHRNRGFVTSAPTREDPGRARSSDWVLIQRWRPAVSWGTGRGGVAGSGIGSLKTESPGASAPGLSNLRGRDVPASSTRRPPVIPTAASSSARLPQSWRVPAPQRLRVYSSSSPRDQSASASACSVPNRFASATVAEDTPAGAPSIRISTLSRSASVRSSEAATSSASATNSRCFPS